jgi:hypothetical protein
VINQHFGLISGGERDVAYALRNQMIDDEVNDRSSAYLDKRLRNVMGEGPQSNAFATAQHDCPRE